jgi:hypothetical protein
MPRHRLPETPDPINLAAASQSVNCFHSIAEVDYGVICHTGYLVRFHHFFAF